MCISMWYADVVYMPYHWTVRLQLTAVLLQLLVSLISFDISKFPLQALSWQHHHQIRPRNVHTHTTPVLKFIYGTQSEKFKVPFGSLAGFYRHFGGICRLTLQIAI